MAALVLVRRRWPLGVACLGGGPAALRPDQLPGHLLGGAAAGRRHRLGRRLPALDPRRRRLVRGRALGYFVYQLEAQTEPVMPLLNGTLQSAAMFAAVLLLGEAVRSRRALDRANRLLLAEQDRPSGCSATSFRPGSRPGSSRASR